MFIKCEELFSSFKWFSHRYLFLRDYLKILKIMVISFLDNRNPQIICLMPEWSLFSSILEIPQIEKSLGLCRQTLYEKGTSLVYLSFLVCLHTGFLCDHRMAAVQQLEQHTSFPSSKKRKQEFFFFLSAIVESWFHSWIFYLNLLSLQWDWGPDLLWHLLRATCPVVSW